MDDVGGDERHDDWHDDGDDGSASKIMSKWWGACFEVQKVSVGLGCLNVFRWSISLRGINQPCFTSF